MITNSVVPMPNAPAVSAYSASGVRGWTEGERMAAILKKRCASLSICLFFKNHQYD
jgi:hypothetical protein